MEKTREHLLFTAHQEILIQYVENNLTIIQCKNGDFSFNLSKVTSFFSFSESPGSLTQLVKKKNVKIFFHDASEFSHSFCRE